MEFWLPTDEQKRKAINELPYLKNEDFIQVRKDDRSETTYAFIRRPAYYAICNNGKQVTKQQRYGLGLLWHPLLGTVIQSQSRSDEADFGTRADGKEQTYEAGDLPARMEYRGQPWTPETGKNDLMGGGFEISYSLGEYGHKEIIFEEDRVSVRVEHTGKFTERIPLLKSPQSDLKWDKDRILLQQESTAMVIRLKHASGIRSSRIETDLYDKECHAIHIDAEDHLEYEILFQ
jgi:hypothetical protein